MRSSRLCLDDSTRSAELSTECCRCGRRATANLQRCTKNQRYVQHAICKHELVQCTWSLDLSVHYTDSQTNGHDNTQLTGCADIMS